MQYVKWTAKALLAALLAGLGVLAGFVTNNTAISDITVGQWITVAVAALIAFGGVFGVSNGAKPK